MKKIKLNMPNGAHAKEAYLALVQSPGWYSLGGGFVTRLYSEGSVALEFRPFGDEWRLAYITTPKEDREKGLASRALSEVTAAADRAGVGITLDVDPQDDGGLSKDQLFQWYARHGFERKPYGMQPDQMSDGMARSPAQKRVRAESFLNLFEGKDLSCVMAYVEGETLDLLRHFAASIPEDDIYDDEEKHHGRENEPHVTALFGLKTQEVNDVRPVLEKFKAVEFTLGKTSLFKNEKYHVLKFGVESPDLTRMNRELSKMPHETDFPDYCPHLTIAYLKPDSAVSKKYAGVKNFDGMVVRTRKIVFSNGSRKKTTITL